MFTTQQGKDRAVGENFAFFLPIMMATFSIAFLGLWRWGVGEAFYWSAGYVLAACGFAIPLFAGEGDPAYWPLLADALFASAFLAYGSALLQRWRPHWLLTLRIGIWGLSILLSAWSIFIHNLPLELVASDLGCFLLISVPLVAGLRHMGSTVDRVLFAAICLVAFDNLFRAATISLTIAPDGSELFIDSGYAFLMQALAMIFGLFMGLAALAAGMTDVIARLRNDAHVDPLSGLFNRRGFDHAITPGPSGVAAQGCIITCDIDHFKLVNDTHGHAAGDRVIAAVAALIRRSLPPGAVAARFGGEEFILFLPRADAGAAARLAEGMRVAFTEQVHRDAKLDMALSASFGLAITMGSDYSLHDAIARADLALYEAKKSGRNRISVWRSLEASPDQRPDSASHVA